MQNTWFEKNNIFEFNVLLSVLTCQIVWLFFYDHVKQPFSLGQVILKKAKSDDKSRDTQIGVRSLDLVCSWEFGPEGAKLPTTNKRNLSRSDPSERQRGVCANSFPSFFGIFREATRPSASEASVLIPFPSLFRTFREAMFVTTV